MKSKGFTYLLVIVVAIVWYNVFFRIKSNLMGDDVIPSPNSAQFIKLQSHIRDTFTLHANYRDPFEGVSEKPVEVINPNLPIIPVQTIYVPPKITPVHQWPKVQYYGLMKKRDSKKPLCILNFDDMLLNLRAGDYFFDDYLIKAIYKDSVVIQHKNFRKTFFKK